jgi:hypothetical protein
MKKIIISGKEKNLNPVIALIMSLAFTGMGEFYSGFPQKGAALALTRSLFLIIIPFYAIVYEKYSYMTEVLISLILFAAIIIFSPVYAYKISSKRKKITIQRLSSNQSIIIFAVFNVIITVISLNIFLSNFSIMRVFAGSDHFIDMGDIIVSKKVHKDSFHRGEMVLVKGDEFRLARIIGLYGENIIYKKGRFSIDGSELFQSIFTEPEMKKLSLTDYDVISESDGFIKYPVIQKKDNFTYKNTLKKDEYLIVQDNRQLSSGFDVVKGEDIYARIDGILFSPKRFKFLIKPFLISEN